MVFLFQKIFEGIVDFEKEIFVVLSDVQFLFDIDRFIREILCFDIKFFVCVMFYDGGVLGFFKNYYFFFCKFDIVVILR